jgi:hypothetical protein
MNIQSQVFGISLSGPWRKRITIGLLLSTVGCTTSPRLSSIDAGIVAAPIEFVDYSGQHTDKGPRDASLWLGAIPGEIYGTTTTEIKTLGIGSSTAIAVPMAELERFSARRPTRLTPAAVAVGFTITPSDTRLLRIATSLLSEDPRWHSAGTNLADSSTKKTLVLVYFDRSCHLSGAVITHPSSGGTRTANYDVVIEKAGLNWLEITQIGDDFHSEVRHAPATARPVVMVRAKENAI